MSADDFPLNLREGDLGEDTVVIYNRVPKTGSTSFEDILYQLSTVNNFHSIHLNTVKVIRVLGLADQRRFITNITNWHEKMPAVYHGHLAYIDFSRLGVRRLPIYINMIREPLSRLISHYYFVRYGDDYDPSKVHRKADDERTFDECVAMDDPDCGPAKMWMQIPFFCGHAAECLRPGSAWALEEAKRNLLHHYLVVGITEKLPEFLMVLEAALPRFFRGALKAYERGSTTHLRKTVQKTPPSEKTLQKIEKYQAYRMERAFYRFAFEQFDFIMERTINQSQPNKYRPIPKIFSLKDSAERKDRIV